MGMDIYARFKLEFGSIAGLAELLDVNPMTIRQWKARGRIPAERCPEIVAVSNGRIALHELRPDLYAEPSKPVGSCG